MYVTWLIFSRFYATVQTFGQPKFRKFLLEFSFSKLMFKELFSIEYFDQTSWL